MPAGSTPAASTPAGNTSSSDTPPQLGRSAAAGSSDLLPMTSWRHVAQHLQAVLRGEFVIEREIGRGGMAAVYLAREVRLNRRVALKVMSPSLLSGHGMVERFQQEAVTVANLSHANIVTVHAVRDIDDLHFFVMKFVDGRALDRILAAERRLPLAVVRSILFQVGGALSYAHRHGVVHRDIKPANILIDKSGDAVVTDFGIAKVAESSAHTQTGMLIGTPTYMSPEQCLGLPVSAASDQYALGIVAYELLTGAPPFAGPSLMVLQAHISRPPTPVGELAPDCPADVAAAVARMLAKDPAERWPTIGQAVQALGGGPLAEDDPLRETLAAMAGAPAPGAPVPTAAPLTPLMPSTAPAAPVAPVSTAPTPPAPPVAPPAPPPPPPPPVPGTVRLTIPEGDWEVGDAVEAAAAVLATDGAAMPEEGVSWTSEPAEVAEVDAFGRVTFRAPGKVTIRATAGEARGEATLDVAPARPTTITVDAAPDPLRVGDSWRPSVTVRDRRSATLDVPVALDSTLQSVARVTDGGEVEAVAPGAAILRLTAGELTHEVPLAVTRAAVATIELETSEREPEMGDRVQCTARALDRRGEPVPEAPIVWRSSDARVATVDAEGGVTTANVGTTTISAEADGRRTTVQVRVRRPSVASIDLETPSVGMRAGELVQLKAIVRDRRGNVLDRPVRWTVADAKVLDLAPDGAAEACAAGKTTVTAECEGQRKSADVSVIAASITELFRPVPAMPAAPPIERRPEPVIAPEPEVAAPTLFVEAPKKSAEYVAPAAVAPVAPPPAAPPHTEPAYAAKPASIRLPAPTGTATQPIPPTTVVTVEHPAATTQGGRRILGPAIAAGVLIAVGGWWMATRSTSSGGPDSTAVAPVETTPVPTPSTDPASPPAGTSVPTTTPTTPVSPPPANPKPEPSRPAPSPSTPASSARGGSTTPSRPNTTAQRPTTTATTPASRPSSTASSQSSSAPTVPAQTVPSTTPTVAVTPPPPEPRPDPAPPVASPPATTSPSPATIEAVNTAEARTGMQRAVAAYVGGISSRSVGDMQRIYPSMPSDTRRNWDAVFKSVKSVDANASDLSVTPAGADAGTATLSLVVSFPNPANKRPCTTTTPLRLRLTRNGSSWRITSLEQTGGDVRSAGCG